MRTFQKRHVPMGTFTNFAHLRDEHNIFTTVCRLVNDRGVLLSTGYARVSPKDNPNKKIGRAISRGRCLKAYFNRDRIVNQEEKRIEYTLKAVEQADGWKTVVSKFETLMIVPPFINPDPEAEGIQGWSVENAHVGIRDALKCQLIRQLKALGHPVFEFPAGISICGHERDQDRREIMRGRNDNGDTVDVAIEAIVSTGLLG